MKETKGFFSTFCDIEVEVDSPAYLMMLTFKYAPSHVEVISPEKIDMKNVDFGELLSELTRKIHQYDEVTRVLQLQLRKHQEKIKELEDSKESNNKEKNSKK
jgi:hypothetical protein